MTRNPYFGLDNLQQWCDDIDQKYNDPVTTLRMHHSSRRHLIMLMNKMDIPLDPTGNAMIGEVTIIADREFEPGEVHFVTESGKVFAGWPASERMRDSE